MKHFQQRKKKRRMMYSKWVAALLLFLTVVISGSVYDLYNKKKQVVKLKEVAETELANIKSKDENITKQIEILSTSRGKEEILRQKYNIKRQGESLIVVTDKEPEHEGIPVVEKTFLEEFKGFWGRVFGSA